MSASKRFELPRPRGVVGLAALLFAAAACSSPVEVDVQLLSPCNDEDAIDSVDFLEFQARGTQANGEPLDPRDYTTSVEVSQGQLTEPIPIPLVEDFELVVRGYQGSPGGAPVALGVSTKTNLIDTEESVVPIRVPFARVDSFYRTTDLASGNGETECSEMRDTRFGATATHLRDQGTVLIVGGEWRRDNGGATEFNFTSLAEIYDPRSGAFYDVPLDPKLARGHHAATRLEDGRVLVTGGESLISTQRSTLVSAFIIEPQGPDTAAVATADVFTMRNPRAGHSSVKLADGRVVLIGGRVLVEGQGPQYVADIEIFDPDKKIVTIPTAADGVSAARLDQARFGHSAVLLKTGTDILVAGGYNDSGVLRGMEILHIEGNQVSITVPQATLSVGPISHAAASLAEQDETDGRVIFSGGYDSLADAQPQGSLPQNSSAAVEMWEYQDATKTLVRTCSAQMTTGRGLHTVNLIAPENDKALFVGGRGSDGMPLATAEVASLVEGGDCFASTPSVIMMEDARTEHDTAVMDSGEVLVVGGLQNADPTDVNGFSIGRTEVFLPARDL